MAESAAVICLSDILLVRAMWLGEVVSRSVRRLPVGDQVGGGNGSESEARLVRRRAACATFCFANGDNDVNFGRSHETECGAIRVKCE